MRKALVLTASLLLAGLAGCGWWGSDQADPTVVEMVLDARSDAAKLPESPEKAVVVARLEALTKALKGEPSSEASRTVTGSRWYEMFGPAACEVSYFTKFADFNEDGARDGLLVRVRLEDRFGDPIKAVGAFRIEAFNYVVRSNQTRGSQLSNWYVSLYSERDLRRYYDGIDRSFRFPLKFAVAPETDRIVVQVTYYLPDGSGRKLFGERVVKVEQ